MYLVVGLGNPGQRYAGTRHNIGFSAVTVLADENRISFDGKKHKALLGKGMVAGHKAILAQPLTYMNLSGESVQELVHYYKIDIASELIVIYDDISLPPGKLRIRAKGSAGGHNGVKSIISCLGSDTFPRIRIGVGEKPAGWDLADYVLGRFPGKEEPAIREALAKVAKACGVMMEQGIGAAMNQFN